MAEDQPPIWQPNWNGFVTQLFNWIQSGDTLEQVATRVQGTPVTWTGVLSSREIPNSPRRPFAYVDMPVHIIQCDRAEYKASLIKLIFDRSVDVLAEWWRVPLGGSVTFQGVLGSDTARPCVNAIGRDLCVSFCPNARLVSRENCTDTDPIPQEVQIALSRPLPVTERVPPPRLLTGLRSQSDIEWSSVRNTQIATLIPGGDAEGAVVEFWERVLDAFPSEGKWKILQLWGNPSSLEATVLFHTADLSEQYPILHAFSFGGIEWSLLMAPGTTRQERRLAWKSMKSFWALFHAGLCTARNLKQFREARPDVTVLAQESGESTFKELLLS